MYNIDNIYIYIYIYVVSWRYRFAANDNKDCLQVQMTELIQFRPTRLISQLVTMSLGYTTALPVTATARPSGRSSRVVTISPAPAASLPTMASRTGKCMPWDILRDAPTKSMCHGQKDRGMRIIILTSKGFPMVGRLECGAWAASQGNNLVFGFGTFSPPIL